MMGMRWLVLGALLGTSTLCVAGNQGDDLPQARHANCPPPFMMPPDYPQSELAKGRTGYAIVIIVTDECGRAVDVEIERSSGFKKLDSAAVSAARSWIRPHGKGRVRVQMAFQWNKDTETPAVPAPERLDANGCPSPRWSRPDYPRNAQLTGKDGTVVLDLALDECGRVLDAQVHTRSKWKSLDAAAVAAAKQWVFGADTEGSIAEPRRIQVPVTFELPEEESEPEMWPKRPGWLGPQIKLPFDRR
jgi:TonB family protein